MENGIVNMSRVLEPRGFEMHVCCLSEAGRSAARFASPGRIHALGKGEGFSLAAVRSLAAEIKRVAPDIIHSHNFGPLIYTALAAPGAKRRLLHGEHAELTAGELSPRRKFLRRLLYSRTARVHTVSNALRDGLIAQGFPGSHISVVVNGVDSSWFTPASKVDARINDGLPVNATILGLVGRFGEFKRHLALIESLERLPEMPAPVHLLFVGGGGPMEQAVRDRAAASSCASRIHFAGYQVDTRPWYHSLDLLVVPSVNEGLSNAILEAMACGIPALAHTACGSSEVIVDGVNGFLRNLDGPAMDAALIAALRETSSFERLGASARATVQAAFSLDSMADGYERLYRSMLSSGETAGSLQQPPSGPV